MDAVTHRRVTWAKRRPTASRPHHQNQRFRMQNVDSRAGQGLTQPGYCLQRKADNLAAADRPRGNRGVGLATGIGVAGVSSGDRVAEVALTGRERFTKHAQPDGRRPGLLPLLGSGRDRDVRAGPGPHQDEVRPRLGGDQAARARRAGPGINTTLYKLWAFALASFLTGVTDGGAGCRGPLPLLDQLPHPGLDHAVGRGDDGRRLQLTGRGGGGPALPVAALAEQLGRVGRLADHLVRARRVAGADHGAGRAGRPVAQGPGQQDPLWHPGVLAIESTMPHPGQLPGEIPTRVVPGASTGDTYVLWIGEPSYRYERSIRRRSHQRSTSGKHASTRRRWASSAANLRRCSAHQVRGAAQLTKLLAKEPGSVPETVLLDLLCCNESMALPPRGRDVALAGLRDPVADAPARPGLVRVHPLRVRRDDPAGAHRAGAYQPAI